MSFLDLKDVICLLRSEVERAGGQTAWARKTGIDRVTINRVLNDRKPPTKKIISALKLRMVFVPYPKLPESKWPTTKASPPDRYQQNSVGRARIRSPLAGLDTPRLNRIDAYRAGLRVSARTNFRIHARKGT